MYKPDELQSLLEQQQYIIDETQAFTVSISLQLEKPLLVEGPAGVGKTELAKGLAAVLDAPLIRLQCYEGLGEEKALYEWNYSKQLLHIQAEKNQSWQELSTDIFSEDYLLERPLLQSIRSGNQSVLLIDELDRVDEEFEAFLLELLSDFQITIPEMGAVQAIKKPVVVLTSNATRELSEALRRRCIYLYMDFPTPERERDIILKKIPGIESSLADQLVRTVQRLRESELKKPPSISETLDWAQALQSLGITELNQQTLTQTSNVLLKHRSDLQQINQIENLLSDDH